MAHLPSHSWPEFCRWKFAVSLEGKDVVLSGVLNKDNIAVKSLKAADVVLEIDNFDRIQMVK